MKTGFSLIELMIVLSIISLLSIYSVYGIQHHIDQRQLTGAVGLLSSSLTSAQSNSRASGFTTIICPSENFTGCDRKSIWSNGWISYNDLDKSHTLDPEEPVIAVSNTISGDVTIRFTAPGTPQKVIFSSSGRLWPNGHFKICHMQTREGVKIILTQSGRIRSSEMIKADCPARP